MAFGAQTIQSNSKRLAGMHVPPLRITAFIPELLVLGVCDQLFWVSLKIGIGRFPKLATAFL